MLNVLTYLKCHFSMEPIYTKAEVIKAVEEYLKEYSNLPLAAFDVSIRNITNEIDMNRYIRETLVIEFDEYNITNHYVTYPTCITIEKELRGYTLVFKIRAIDNAKVLKLVELAHEMISAQDDINYPLEVE